METQLKAKKLSQSLISLPKTEKQRTSFFASNQKLSSKYLYEENKKLKKLVTLLKNNLQISEENLKKVQSDNSNFEYIAMQNFRIKSLETRLNETELQLNKANQKVLKMQQELKNLIKEKNELQESVDQKDVTSETYRVMKDKVLETFFKLFNEDSTKCLNFRYLELENEFLTIFPALVKKHPSIEVLDLEGNFITDSGVKKLAELVINTDVNLFEINLNNNKITIEGAWTMLKALKLREETKFKKLKKVSILNNLIERPADIYLKINEHVKAFRDSLSPNKFKLNELRRSSFSTANRIFSTEMSNVKEVQDLIEILDRLIITQVNDFKVPHRSNELVHLSNNTSQSDKLVEALELKYSDDKKLFSIKGLYLASGELLTSTIEAFVKNGGNIDEVDLELQETLLMHACRVGNIRLVKKILSYKPDLETKNKQGFTAFLIACSCEQYEILTLLAQCGSNLNASNLKGAKAIHLAVKEQKPQTICRLIELGLKVNCKDAHAKTPLHYAARVGDIEIGKLLIQLGAQLNHIDFKGRTPAGLAEEKEHFHFADMLEGLGGKRVKSYEDRSMFKKETLSVSNLQSLNIELSKELITANKVYKKLYKNIE